MDPRERNVEYEEQANWHINSIEQVLNSYAQPTRDVAFGEGLYLGVGPEARTQLELYEDASVARITTEDVRVELHRTVPIVNDRGVVFNATQDVQPFSMVLEPSGTLMLFIGTVPAGEHKMGTSQSEIESAGTIAVPQVRSQEHGEQAPRVVLTGRVGGELRMRTRPRGHNSARMLLGVHHGDSEKADWHTVLFFDERADKAMETIRRGQLLTVIGFKHFRDVPRKDGGVRRVEEIYATAVQPPK